jgi:transcriptional regulator with XRE-family HTH domain
VRKTIYSPEQQTLSRLLRDQRHRRGATQVQVAEALGRTQSYVAKYESGERRLDVIELRAICMALGTSLPAFARRLDTALDNL